jgi:preprotein translocase subunit SecF
VLWGLSRKKSCAATEAARPAFHFVSARKYFLIVIACMLLLGVGSFALRGFNPDVDFTGGTTMQVEFDDALSAEGANEISDAMLDEIVKTVESAKRDDGTALGVEVSSAQRANRTDVILKLSELNMDDREAVFDALRERFGLASGALVSVSNVGATVSAEIRRDAILATVVAILLMMLYISIRFDFHSGLAAVICLAHDVLIMLIAYSLFAIPLNTNMIAALLTILGYSINATIVIFDRVRENRKKMLGCEFGEVINISIRQTFRRSLNTTVTTFLTIFMVYLLGVTSIRQFALPLIVGILAGLFSSVCLAGNLWAVLARHIRFGKKKKTESGETA